MITIALLLFFSAYTTCEEVAAANTPTVAAPDPGKSESAFFRGLGYAMFAVKTGDTLSTYHAEARGGVELNPVMGSDGARIALTVAAPAVIYWGTGKIYPEHPKLATAVRLGAIGLWGYAIAHNLRGAR